MRAFGLSGFDSPPAFTELPVPVPGDGELLDAGCLRVPIQRSYGLEEAGEALAALPATHVQGKLAISVA